MQYIFNELVTHAMRDKLLQKYILENSNNSIVTIMNEANKNSRPARPYLQNDWNECMDSTAECYRYPPKLQ